MKIGRNDPCHCGSGKKYKFCHYAEDSAKKEQPVPEEQAAAAAASGEESGAEEEEGKASEQSKPAFDREKGRGRFHGNKKGGSSSFSPRAFRGSQRGS